MDTKQKIQKIITLISESQKTMTLKISIVFTKDFINDSLLLLLLYYIEMLYNLSKIIIKPVFQIYALIILYFINIKFLLKA